MIEIILHFLYDLENKEKAWEEFLEEFGKNLLDKCDEYEIMEG